MNVYLDKYLFFVVTVLLLLSFPVFLMLFFNELAALGDMSGMGLAPSLDMYLFQVALSGIYFVIVCTIAHILYMCLSEIVRSIKSLKKSDLKPERQAL